MNMSILESLPNRILHFLEAGTAENDAINFESSDSLHLHIEVLIPVRKMSINK
jgi:hypothetical protein